MINKFIKSYKKHKKSIYYEYNNTDQNNFTARIVINKNIDIYRVLYGSFYGINITKDEK